jgi:quercetin dioxygenase-like cupin family protein
MTTPAVLHRSFVYKGVRISDFLANKGEGLPKHEHTYSHGVVCIAGSCVIRKENLELVLTSKDDAVVLAANEWHEIEALEDNTIFVNME